ncbi:MAG: hypothetical protein WDZ85_00675 [Candidatus Paceibacterota bacterium]
MRTIELEDYLGVIRVVSTPEGEAPEEVREKWVGVEIPCLYYVEDTPGATGVLTGRFVFDLEKVYVVLQENAISSLEVEASKWWKQNGFPSEEGAMFSFCANSIEEVKTVLSRREFVSLLQSLSV